MLLARVVCNLPLQLLPLNIQTIELRLDPLNLKVDRILRRVSRDHKLRRFLNLALQLIQLLAGIFYTGLDLDKVVALFVDLSFDGAAKFFHHLEVRQIFHLSV